YIDGVDFAMRSHGTDRDNETALYPGGFSARHIEELKYTFHGRSAHAQVPWEGISALDSVMLLFHAMEIMREHSEPQFRFHGVVTEGGVAPNIVPDRASAPIWIRHLIDETPVGSVSPRAAREMIRAKVEQMHDAARGAALATGTSVDIDHTGSYVPSISVGAFHRLQFEYAVQYGGVNLTEKKVPKAFEETGFMSLKVPGLHVSMGIEGVPKTTGHSRENADLTVTAEGHRALESLTRVMAAVGLRLLMDSKVRDEIRTEHASWLEKYHQ
ncbi:MAG: peptidase dimerization domain-containing protein, partial [Bacillota bacterium]